MNELEKLRLRNGISTGASAAAASRAAAIMLFRGEKKEQIVIFNLEGLPIEVPVREVEITGRSARAVVIKDGGDDPDVTHGIEIVVQVSEYPEGIELRGGRGVGMVTRPGLQVKVGQPAINPVPREMILQAVSDVVPPGKGLEITITVPRGEEIAGKTLNPRMGIVGGISILGTTGIVRPMSEEAFKNSLEPLVDMAIAAGFRKVVLTPGRMGWRLAVEKYGFPRAAVVEMSNFVGFMLDVCTDRGIDAVLLWGHHGKIIKVAAGIFHTHSRVADGRLETIAAYAGAAGAPPLLLKKILGAATAEEALSYLKQNGMAGVFDTLAARASTRAKEYTRGRLEVGSVLLGLDGSILGTDGPACSIGRELGWTR